MEPLQCEKLNHKLAKVERLFLKCKEVQSEIEILNCTHIDDEIDERGLENDID